MTSKIFKSTFLAGVVCIIACAAVFLGILYQYFEARIFTELQTEADYVSQGVEKAGKQLFRRAHLR
jgi:hypothetical protein